MQQVYNSSAVCDSFVLQTLAQFQFTFSVVCVLTQVPRTLELILKSTVLQQKYIDSGLP